MSQGALSTQNVFSQSREAAEGAGVSLSPASTPPWAFHVDKMRVP